MGGSPPRAYLLQVGDSRCYLFQAGELTQIRRDHGGLTKHVPHNRISERIDAMTSSRQLCEDLVREALDDGGATTSLSWSDVPSEAETRKSF